METKVLRVISHTSKLPAELVLDPGVPSPWRESGTGAVPSCGELSPSFSLVKWPSHAQ